MTKWGLLVLGLALGLAACESTPSPVVEAHRPGLARGIDLPTDSRDVSNELKGSHLDFVARYYRDPASRWPSLSAEEARMVSSVGMNLVTVWESHSHRIDYFNYDQGYADAMQAYRQAKAVGQPADSAIYFAVDFNAQDFDLKGPVDRYFRGITNGFWAAAEGKTPDYRIGVYGSGAVCAYLRRTNLAQYAWLSNATKWSGYDDFADWNIKQGTRAPDLSFDQDVNEARGEYGGFRLPTEQASL